MRGFGPMLSKELREYTRTWRLWLLGGLFAFFGLVDPVISRFAPEILSTVLRDQVPIQLPDPTYLDAAVQWTSDLTQLLMLVVLGVAGAAVAGEVSAGNHVMPLTRPLSRDAFLLSKVVAVILAAALAAVVGTGLASLTTLALFDDVDLLPLWTAVLVWFVLALLLVAVTVAAASAISSTVAALGIGFGTYVLLGILGMWGPARSYSPAGLPAAIGDAAGGGEVALWPVLTGLVAVVVVLGLAVAIFRRREL
ncbi:MAG TPA: ABC transporter permease subunit [Actinomycetales bacterium]|nr:ABC transporter permease subunit [Actinomycetales bacterium]